jgi:cytochrome c oxidase subunit II
MIHPRFSALDPAGPQAGSIHELWHPYYVVSIVVWVVVTVAMIAATVRAYARRRSQGEIDPLAHDPGQDRRLATIVIACTAITVVTLVVLLIFAIGTGDKLAALDDDPHALHVRVTGHQWWWEVQYDPDAPDKTATTANEIHVPVGRTVSLDLESQDVIHSFWVPSVHGKKDLIPGRRNHTAIRIDQPGIYRGQCAEFCGLEHAEMEIRVIAEPPAQFQAYLAHLRQPASSPSSDQAKHGQQVFMSHACASCHTIAGTSAGGRIGPDLTHIASRLVVAASVPNVHGELQGWVADPQGMKPGNRMPRVPLSPDDLEDVVAYLESLR